MPAEAIAWLVKQLQAQQAGLAPLEGIPEGAQAEIADKFSQMGGAAPGAAVMPGGSQGPMSMQAMPSR